VYDITNTPNSHANEAIKTLNRFTRDTFGLGGIFHGAVEIGACVAQGARVRVPWRVADVHGCTRQRNKCPVCAALRTNHRRVSLRLCLLLHSPTKGGEEWSFGYAVR
jgi:hypothetical protein